MKLRNKKTGEIITLKEKGELALLKLIENSLPNGLSLWEEVKEPLIKDEKIRKAIRAWAELNSIKSVAFEDYDDENIYFIDRDYEPQIWFSKTRIAWELDDGKIYTITELCGEEEE